MKRYELAGVSLLVLGAVGTATVWFVRPPGSEAHCQVPCGIYDDPARIAQLREDATTIEKAIANIKELADKHDPQSLNQAVRWVNTKEEHAAHVMETVSEYFLAQKVKPVAPGGEGYDAYLKSLADHHAVIVAAMKAKQNADAKYVEELRKAIDALAAHYK
jgi:nickel superoxide dismutase